MQENKERDPDRDFGHVDWQHQQHGHGASSHPGASASDAEGAHHGALERMREAAVHAVEGVKLRLHLSREGGHPTAEERTGEPMHMAKAAEGRNKAEDDPIDHALHDALKLERGEKPEVSAFPETLGDAFAAAQMRDLPSSPPSAAALAGAAPDAPAAPNPFTSGARAKL